MHLRRGVLRHRLCHLLQQGKVVFHQPSDLGIKLGLIQVRSRLSKVLVLVLPGRPKQLKGRRHYQMTSKWTFSGPCDCYYKVTNGH